MHEEVVKGSIKTPFDGSSVGETSVTLARWQPVHVCLYEPWKRILPLENTVFNSLKLVDSDRGVLQLTKADSSSYQESSTSFGELISENGKPFPYSNISSSESSGDIQSNSIRCFVDRINFQSDKCMLRKNCQPGIEAKVADDRKKSKFFLCKICDKVLRSAWGLNTHLRCHARLKPFHCELCKYACVTKSALVKHSRRHTGERPFNCQVCHKRFKTSNTLKLHQKLHAGDKRFDCNKAYGNLFLKSTAKNNRPQKKVRISVNHPDTVCVKLLKCIYCFAKFSSEVLRKLHCQNAHSNQINEDQRTNRFTVKCSFCSTSLLNFYCLNEHIRELHRDQLLKCNLCSFVCSSEKLREDHAVEMHFETVASGLGAFFMCKYCNLSFRSFAEKELHIFTHFIMVYNEEYQNVGYYTDEKDDSDNKMKINKVEKCVPQTLNRFHKIYNIDCEIFKCKFCFGVFANLRCLKLHLKTHDKKHVLKCPECPLEFWQKYKFAKHVKMHKRDLHRHQCKHCGTLLSSDFRKYKHMRNCSRKVSLSQFLCYSCPECSSVTATRLALVNHIKLVHHQPWPLLCSVCSAHFVNIQVLQKHINDSHKELTVVLGPEKFILSASNSKLYFLQSNILTPFSGLSKNTGYVLAAVSSNFKPTNSIFMNNSTASSCVNDINKFSQNEDSVIVCSVCDKSFMDYEHFTRHWVASCSFNGDSFYSLGLLSDGHCFVCTWCVKTFSSMAALVDHEVTIHLCNDNTVFSCRSCGRTFSLGKHCLEHYLNVHCQDWRNSMNGSSFAISEECDSTFSSQTDYRVLGVGAVVYTFYSDECHDGTIEENDSNVLEVIVTFNSEAFTFMTSFSEKPNSSPSGVTEMCGTISKVRARRNKWKLE